MNQSVLQIFKVQKNDLNCTAYDTQCTSNDFKLSAYDQSVLRMI